MDVPARAHLPVLPRTRGDCVSGPRPCPHLLCRHHLGNREVQHSKRVVLREIPAGEDTCSLDVADRGESLPLEAVAEKMGTRRQRIHKIESGALRKVRKALAEWAPPE